jgi:hypothetical protein
VLSEVERAAVRADEMHVSLTPFVPVTPDRPAELLEALATRLGT